MIKEITNIINKDEEARKLSLSAYLNDMQTTAEDNKRHPRYVDAIKDIKKGLGVVGFLTLFTNNTQKEIQG